MSIRTETNFTLNWAEAVIDRVYNSSTLPEAITVTAGFLAEIIDELHRLNDREQDVEYLTFINQTLGEMDSSSPEHARLFWTSAQEIFQIYETLPGMEEWEVEFEATQRLAQMLDPRNNRLDEVWMMLGSVIAYLQGWTHGEAEGIRERSQELELLLSREWPDKFPEDRPPDGLEEYEKTGVE